MDYNLLEEEWIPVLYKNGEWRRVGIRKALEESDIIRQIAASNPMDRLAILRFLLALLYWCKGNPPDNMNAEHSDAFPADWFSKLEEKKDCFNLLGKGKRFYQYRKDGDKELSANYLIHEIPTGTNHWHLRHSTDEVNGLCPACCAMGLLRLPLFSTSAGRGKPPGINAKPPVYIIPVGHSLAATVRHSWRQISDLGTPAWEQPDIQLPTTGEVPQLTGLTWLPRRVWLGKPEEPEANCISCGRRDRLILDSVFAPIGSTKTEQGRGGRVWRDPHVIYEQSRKGDIISLHPRDALSAADAGAGQWARILAGMLRKNEASSARPAPLPDAWVVGFSTVRNDKYLETIEFLVPSSSSHQVQEAIERIERWQKEGSALTKRLRPRNQKSVSRRHVEIPPMVNAIRPHVEGRVTAMAKDLITGGDQPWQQAAEEYRPLMHKMARSLSPGFTTTAVQRRREIAYTVPDMRQKRKEANKPGGKKGGKK